MTDADLESYLKVGERQHVREAKQGIIVKGGSPILTTIDAIKNFIRSSLVGGNKDTIKGYGKVGGRMSSDVATASGGATNIANYYLELDGNRINHLKDHVEADAGGRNFPLTEEQVENITEYIDNYDQILDVHTRKDGSTRIYLSKETQDGTVVIVELVSKGRMSLQPVTAWQNTRGAFAKAWGIKKGARNTSSAAASTATSGYKQAPGNAASSAAPETNVSTKSIRSGGAKVKTEGKKSDIGSTWHDAMWYGDKGAQNGAGDARSAGGAETPATAQKATETGSAALKTATAAGAAQGAKNAAAGDYSAAAKKAYEDAAPAQRRLDSIAGRIARSLGVRYENGVQKSVSSIMSRLTRNAAKGKGADIGTLKDLARTHIEMSSWEDIPKVLKALDKMGVKYTASAKSTPQGYRGLHVTWSENGIGCELQLSTPEAWAVKMKTEEIYAKWRDIELGEMTLEQKNSVRRIRPNQTLSGLN